MTQELLSEGRKIVEDANQRGITLRLLGATAIMIHSPKDLPAFDKLNRQLSDIDFMALSKQEKKVIEFLQEKSYIYDRTNRSVAMTSSSSRYIFEHPTNKMHVDIFFDKLQMCHTIDFTKRLSVDSPTISLADLLLEKMQIVEINEKDLKDTLVLLREHEIDTHDNDTINQTYVSGILSRDWGFYYTVTQNLNKVRDAAQKYPIFEPSDQQVVKSKIDKLLDAIERQPKTMGWKMRSKIGTKQRWYTEVEDVSR